MKALKTVACALAATLAAAPALAQDDGLPTTNGVEPYVGVLGGLHDFDDEQYKGAPPLGGSGGFVEGVVGVNLNFGRFFVGAEGSGAKGFTGDLDWEYGAAGRFGVRAGKDSLFFGKVGYQWTEFALPANGDRAYDGITFGFGMELSAADMGMFSDTSPIRLRAGVDTRGDFHSFRPSAGLVLKF